MSRFAIACAATCLAARSLVAQAAPHVPPPERQIAAAVLPLPDSLRAGAAVLGYTAEGRLVPLREGTNHLICLADDPRETQVHVACYHESLEPFMARGRELRAQRLGPEAVDSIRFADVAAGRIRMPAVASLYSLTGSPGSYDSATNTIRAAGALFVVYVPFATEGSTGLSTQPRAGAPWLMAPGTARAHIMFVPGM